MHHQLFKAIRARDSIKLKAILDLNSELVEDVAPFNHKTSLDIAVEEGSCDMMEILEKYLHVNLKELYEETPDVHLRLVTIAAVNNKSDMIHYLDIKNNDLWKYDFDGNNPFVMAAKVNACNAIQTLHELGATKDIRICSMALAAAVEAYNIDAAKLIVRLQSKCVGICLSLKLGFAGEIRYHHDFELLEYVLHLENTFYKEKTHPSSDYLYKLIMCENRNIFDHCIRLGVDINEKTSNGNTIMDICISEKCASDSSSIRKFLIDRGAKVNPTSYCTYVGAHEYAENGDLSSVLFLLDNDLDVNYIGSVKWKSLLYRCLMGYDYTKGKDKIIEFIDEMCRRGADINLEYKPGDLYRVLQTKLAGCPIIGGVVSYVIDKIVAMGYNIPTLPYHSSGGQDFMIGSRGCYGEKGRRGCEGRPGCHGKQGCSGPKGCCGPTGRPGCEGRPGCCGKRGCSGPQGCCGPKDCTRETMSSRIFRTRPKSILEWATSDNIKWLALRGYVLDKNGDKDVGNYLKERRNGVKMFLNMCANDHNIPNDLLRLISIMSDGVAIDSSYLM